MGTLTKIALCAIAGLTLCQGSASGSEAVTAKANRIRVSYVPPKDLEHQPLYEGLKAARALEQMQVLLGPLRLPRPLLLKLEGCDGVSNAWYDEGAVTVCYEYLDEVWKNAHLETRPKGITLRAALVGPLFDVFLHEVGHALFDLLAIPLFGPEEDAADALSAYVMLQLGREEARELVAGTAYSYAVDLGTGPQVAGVRRPSAREVKYKLDTFADEHGTPAQRFYNLMCIAYGADPKLFADVLEQDLLPRERAENCEFEYLQVAYAYEKLIAPHLDRKLASKLRGRSWLRPATSPPPYRPATAPAKRP